MSHAPTIPPPEPDSLNSSLRRNIEALRRRREEEDARANFEQRLASAITRFSGSMNFVFGHLALYGFWIVANLGWIPALRAWDPTLRRLASQVVRNRTSRTHKPKKKTPKLIHRMELNDPRRRTVSARLRLFSTKNCSQSSMNRIGASLGAERKS